MEDLTMLSRHETMVRLGLRLAHVESEVEGVVLDELIMKYREGLLEVLFDEDGQPRFRLAPGAKNVH